MYLVKNKSVDRYYSHAHADNTERPEDPCPRLFLSLLVTSRINAAWGSHMITDR